MAKLSKEQLTKEINDKGFKAVDISGYENLKSYITVECENGHKTKTQFYNFRKSTFRCSMCGGSDFKYKNKPPVKKGYRIIALDNATQKMGLSIFDDGELVYYDLIRFTGGKIEDRLVKIFNTINNIFIKKLKPDLIIFEDIQYQNNYQTYKKLSMLLGILIVSAKLNGIEYEVIAPAAWRSHFQIVGKRGLAKAKAIELVYKMYNVSLGDDVAEAVLIGKYYADKFLNEKKLKRAF